MRNISLGAAKKNVDSSGLEGALMKAKGDAAQLKAELMELKKSGAGKADSSSSKGGARSKKKAASPPAPEIDLEETPRVVWVARTHDQLEHAVNLHFRVLC